MIFSFFFFLLIFFSPLPATTPLKLLEGVQVVHINSLRQRMVDKAYALFEGHVEVILDKTLHIWAAQVEVDDVKKILVARRVGNGQVKIESNKFLILADLFTINLNDRTGVAENIKIHVREGYFSAKKATRIGEYSWELESAWYTPCDADDPHWQLYVKKVLLQGYFARLSHVFFKLGSMPVFWLPRFVMPLQGQSSSGFLLPKLYFDYNDGFGAKLSYYHCFAQRCDTTFSLDLRNRKGIVFSDEFRWARSPENFSLFDAHYAMSRNTFTLKNNNVVPGTRHRYWVIGKDFQLLDNLFGADVRSLLKADFGTDKRIGYQFFNDSDDVDDSFNNALIVRSSHENDYLELKLDARDIERRRFSELTNDEKLLLEKCNKVLQKDGEDVPLIVSTQKELEHHVSSFYLPQFSWRHSNHYGEHCSYEHDCLLDHVYHREHALERLFIHRLVGEENRVMPLNQAQLFRFNYKGVFDLHYMFKGHVINVFISPQLQARSLIEKNCCLQKNVREEKIFARGASRLFASGGAQWTLPALTILSSNDQQCVAYFQSMIAWDYTPYFQQNHWFYIDRWDRVYPQNELSWWSRAYGFVYDVAWSCDLRCAYEFGRQSSIMPLRRGTKDTALLPLEWSFNIDQDRFNFSVQQEYDLCDRNLVQSHVMLMFNLDKLHIGFGYLFHHKKALCRRELLSTIQHFGLLDLSLPVTKHLTIQYDSQLYAEKGKHFFGFKSIKPLLHRVRLEYSGHCWGMYIGYEEKKYRDFGVNKTERAIVFSLSLDSLGSFAKKFSKAPEVIAT